MPPSLIRQNQTIPQHFASKESLRHATYDLLIAKLHALNFDMNTYILIFAYLTGRKQRV